nr:DsbA family protein [Planosporangium flavigriseum]
MLTVSVTFYFDPICPFTWRTSRWIREVAARRSEEVRWRLMSLSVLNEGKEVPEEYRPAFEWSKGALRVLAATDQKHGQEAVDRLYTALGERIHDRDTAKDAATLAGAIADAGLPADLAASAEDTALDAAVRTSHDEAQARVGTETGSPVTAFDGGAAFFGPVLAPIPAGDEADRLFEGLRLLAGVPQFSEVKRARNPL